MFTTALLPLRLIHPDIFSLTSPNKNFLGPIIVSRDCRKFENSKFLQFLEPNYFKWHYFETLEHLFSSSLPWQFKENQNSFCCLKTKTCVRYNFIFHQMIVLQKLWKMFFISSKKLFLFLRYLNFSIFVFLSFFPCQPLL